MQITGIIKKGNELVYGAKVYITNAQNDFIDKTRIGLTDADGKFKISAPTITENGVTTIDTTKYVAFESTRPSGKGIKQLENGKLSYNFDTDSFPRDQELQEFTVTGNKPTSQPTVTQQPVKAPAKVTKQGSKYWWVLPAIIGLICAGGITYIVIKNRKK
jgi:hypothetical protein